MWLENFKEAVVKKIEPEIQFEKLPNIPKKRRQILHLLENNPTPLFIADQDILTNRLSNIKKVLKTSWGKSQIAYSFKTNYEIARLPLLKKEGVWAEVVSGREYGLAKKLGHKGDQIIFNGPLKKDDELRTALIEGAFVNIDNFNELERITKIAHKSKRSFEVGIRINVKLTSIPKSRFGFSIHNNDAQKAINGIEQAKGINLTGIHFHLGTDIPSTKPYRHTAKSVAEFLKNNIKDYQKRIRFLNIGGGFPAHGRRPFRKLFWNPQPIEQYIKAISAEIKSCFGKQKPTLILEPGRYLVDDAVMFVTKVTDKKIFGSRQIVTTDATLTMLPLVNYRRQIIKIFSYELRENKNQLVPSKVYGASCREDDLLYKNYLPKVKVGDFLIYFVTGAYNQNMSSEFIFELPQFYTV